MAKNGTFTFKMTPATGGAPADMEVALKPTGVSFREALKATGREYNKKFQYSLNGEPVTEKNFDKTHVKPGDVVGATEKARGS